MASVDLAEAASQEPPMSAPKTSFTYREEDGCSPFRTELQDLRTRQNHTDFTIISKNGDIPCHKVVLCAASPYLKELFRPGRKDSSAHSIEFTEVDSSLMEDMIEFLYKGTIEINTDTAQDVIKLSDKLGLHKMKEATDQFMADHVDPGNCLGSLVFSRDQNLKLTHQASKICIMTKLSEILRLALDVEYKALPEQFLEEIISNDDLCVKDESLVFEFLVKWVEVESSTRESKFENLLSLVRLPLCSAASLCGVINDCPLMETKACQQLLKEAKMYHMLPECRESINNVRTQPREQSSKSQQRIESQLLILGGGTNEDTPNPVCLRLNEDGSEWEELLKVPGEHQWRLQACEVMGGIVVTGGRKTFSVNVSTDKCWIYSFAEMKWKPLPSMIEARSSHSIAIVGENLYVIGGLHIKHLNSAEMLHPSGIGWESIDPMIKALRYTQTVVHQQYIIVAGGVDYDGTSKLTQMYDTLKGTWQRRSDMPMGCRSGACVLLDDFMYLFDGIDECCLRYSPTQDEWSVLSPPKSKANYPAACVWKGKILLGGGYRSDQIEEYDPATDKWTVCELCLPVKIFGHCMVVREYAPK